MPPGLMPQNQTGSTPVTATTSVGVPSSLGQNAAVEKDSMLESMVQHTGSLDLDDQGNWDFHGHSSGMVFVQRLREQFGDLMGVPERQGTSLSKAQHGGLPHIYESPKSADSPAEPGSNLKDELPSKKCARSLCDLALNDACALMRFLHLPTFWKIFDRVYDTPYEDWGSEEHRNLPLIYALLSIGYLFGKDANSKLFVQGYAFARDSA